MDLCTKLSKKVETLEYDLKKTKHVYGQIYTSLIIKVKNLEDQVKKLKARRKANTVDSSSSADKDLHDAFGDSPK